MPGNARGALAALIFSAVMIGGGGAALALSNSPAPATRAETVQRTPMSENATAHPAKAGSVPMSSPSARVSSPLRSAATASPSPTAPSPGRAGVAEPPPAALPAARTQKWTPLRTPSTRAVTGHDIRENECVSVDGAATWVQQGFSGDSGQTAAIQDTFTFGSAGDAKAAYQRVISGMAQCQAATRKYQSANHVAADAVVKRTASLSSAVAWERGWTGVMGVSAEGPQTNHFYAAASGSKVIILQFTEFPGRVAPYNVAGDPQVLSLLNSELAH